MIIEASPLFYVSFSAIAERKAHTPTRCSLRCGARYDAATRRGAAAARSALKTSPRDQRATSLPVANQTPPACFMC
jgi:hypothetical protein